MCSEIAATVMSNGSVSSSTAASPRASLTRIARPGRLRERGECLVQPLAVDVDISGEHELRTFVEADRSIRRLTTNSGGVEADIVVVERIGKKF